MLLHMLTQDQQKLFLELAHLLSISDDPMLWDGKSETELTGDTDLSKVSFQKSEHEKTMLDAFIRECVSMLERTPSHYFNNPFEPSDWIWESLKNNLKSLPLGKQNDPTERTIAASKIMRQILTDREKGMTTAQPSVPKVMLYELMLLALADGKISTVEGALLECFANQTQLDDDTYNDLLERAESMNREATKTLSLILE